MTENREALPRRRTSDEELDALLGASKTPAEWVAAAEWWLAELGYALPEASPLFKALVAQVKLRGDDRAERERLRELAELRAQDAMGPNERGAWDDLKADRDGLRAENDRLRQWITTEGRNCPSNATVDAALEGSADV